MRGKKTPADIYFVGAAATVVEDLNLEGAKPERSKLSSCFYKITPHDDESCQNG